MSSTRQAVVLSPNFTGLGYFPDLTPFRNDDRAMGSSAGVLFFLLPTICQILKNPVSGSWLDDVTMYCTPLCLLYMVSYYRLKKKEKNTLSTAGVSRCIAQALYF
jgi:hypothetical protein